MKKFKNVTELKNYLNSKLKDDANLFNLYIEGEASNVNYHKKTNYIFFTLKDNSSNIQCISYNFNEKIKNGDKIKLIADIGIWKNSIVALGVKKIIKDGIGELKEKFEKLKNKFEKLGYFKNDIKKEIPRYVNKVAIITSKGSAAESDLIETFNNFNKLISLDIYDSLMQGNEAAKSIIKTLEKIELKNYDVIIIARGGGSIEDLWTFNNEDLIKFIFKLKTPLISAIGHETDFTLLDFISDKRASTPTKSVYLCGYSMQDLINKNYNLQNLMKNNFNRINQNNKNKFNLLIQKIYKNSPENKVNNLKEKIKLLNKNSQNKLTNIFRNNQQNLEKQIIKIKNNKPINKFNNLKKEFEYKINYLINFNPLKILQKGYSVTFDKNNKILNNQELKVNDLIITKTKNYKIESMINKITKKDKNEW